MDDLQGISLKRRQLNSVDLCSMIRLVPGVAGVDRKRQVSNRVGYNPGRRVAVPLPCTKSGTHHAPMKGWFLLPQIKV